MCQVMMGICADDAFEGVAVLKEWVNALRLPRCDSGFCVYWCLFARVLGRDTHEYVCSCCASVFFDPCIHCMHT